MLATVFSGGAKEESNYKRLQRFLRGFTMPYAEVAAFVVKLLALLALAFTRAFVVGQWQAAIKELKLKKHGYPPKSIFRLGLNLLCRLVTNFGHFDLVAWRKAIKLLSCS